MGTSKAYGSPKWPGLNPAVGDAVASGGGDQEIIDAVGIFAGAYKNHLMSGTTISGQKSEDLDSTTRIGRRPPVGGRGGGSGGATRIRSANSGAQFANFINTATQSGLNSALQQFNITEFSDLPLADFLESLADWLSGDGGLLDDDTLSRAMAETIDELAVDIETVDEFDDLLTNGSIDIETTLQVYYANILAMNFEQKEYSYVRGKIDLKNTNVFFSQARDIIRAIVRDELSNVRDLSSIDWNSEEGLRIADQINQEVLEILIP